MKCVNDQTARPRRDYEISFTEDLGLHQLGVYVYVLNDNTEHFFFNAQASHDDVLMHHQFVHSAARFYRSAFSIYLFAIFPLCLIEIPRHIPRSGHPFVLT